AIRVRHLKRRPKLDKTQAVLRLEDQLSVMGSFTLCTSQKQPDGYPDVSRRRDGRSFNPVDAGRDHVQDSGLRSHVVADDHEVNLGQALTPKRDASLADGPWARFAVVRLWIDLLVCGALAPDPALLESGGYRQVGASRPGTGSCHGT